MPQKPVAEDAVEYIVLERFIVALYDKICDAVSIDAAKILRFSCNDRNYSPTSAALLQHTKRAIL